MKQPLISVIVPVYNTDRYTGICIESILKQKYKNLEIIIVDDGSTDRCPEICDLYATKDKRIRVLHKKNKGLVSGRKSGIKIAHGDYIAYVDGDDWVGETYFDSVVKIISETDSDIVISDWTRVLFDQQVIMRNNSQPGIYEGNKLDRLKMQMISKGKFYKHGISTFVWNKVFRREIVYDCQMNVNDKIMIGEDACVSYAAILKSQKVALIDNIDYHYRQHEDSMLKKNRNYYYEIEKLNALYNTLISIDGMSASLKAQASDYVLVSCIIRSGGLCPDHEHYVFGNKFLNKRIVVYSAGTFGQFFVSKILANDSCEIIGWIDDDYWEYRRCCLNVDPVEDIKLFDFDYLIVAAVDGEHANEVRQRLVRLGVDKKQILTMEVPEEDRQQLLRDYLGEV